VTSNNKIQLLGEIPLRKVDLERSKGLAEIYSTNLKRCSELVARKINAQLVKLRRRVRTLLWTWRSTLWRLS